VSGLSIKVKPYGCSYLATLTLKPLTAQPEGGDAEELLRLGSNKRAEQIYALNFKKHFLPKEYY
jgi:hypothetical protein